MEAGASVEGVPAPTGALSLVERIGQAALLAMPGLLVVWFGFKSGGFFPDAPALVALVLSQALALRVTQSRLPFAGMGRLFAAVSLLLAAFAAWILASSLWSDAPGRALVEFDRVLCYVVVFILMGSVVRTAERMRWVLRGVAAGFVIVSGAGFLSRTLPDLVSVASNIGNQRLSFPVTYSNALGLAGALGLLLCFGLAASAREPRYARVVGATAVPLLGATILLTFSRGAILAGAIGLVAFAVVGRPRALLSALGSVAVPTVIAVAVAYHATLLTTVDPTTPAAAVQGEHVALLVACCCAASGALRWMAARWLDRRIAEFRPPAGLRGGKAVLGAAGTGLALLLVLLLALHVPSTVARQYDNFVKNDAPPAGTDLRGRLNVLNNGYRIAYWKVGSHAFGAKPWHGGGGGTYANEWARRRTVASNVTNAHSLYVETLSDYGLVGGVLLFAALLTILVTLLLRARGPRRTLYATLFAATLTWLIHAGVDWDWQMPVVTVWLFGIGGMALAASQTRVLEPGMSDRLSPRQGVRVVVGLACIVSAVTPALLFISQSRLRVAASALERSDWRTGAKESRSAITTLAVRWEPYEMLGYCDLMQGKSKAAIAAMRQAVAKDPDNWEPRFGLAVAKATAGVDPTADIRAALRRNPLEPSIHELADTLRGASRQSWSSRARDVARGALFGDELAIAGV